VLQPRGAYRGAMQLTFTCGASSIAIVRVSEETAAFAAL
jgi:hypothetical protein